MATDPRTAAMVPPEAAELCTLLLSGTRGNRLLAQSASHPLTRALWRAVERATLPGIMAHYLQRKNWIEARCRRAIDSGMTRVLILGAGLDTLGLRLARALPGVEVIELDHPATQHAKQTALASSAFQRPERISFLPCNMAEEPLPARLFADSTPTVVIIEGVLMYLPVNDVRQIFTSLQRLAGGSVQIIFSFMSQWPDGSCGFRPRSWLIEKWLAWRGEPFMWAIEADAMPLFLLQCGYVMREMASARDLSTGHAALEGENLVVCEPASNAETIAVTT